MILDDSDSLKSLAHPTVVSHGSLFSVTACSTMLISHVVSSSSAAPTFNVNNFALALAH